MRYLLLTFFLCPAICLMSQDHDVSKVDPGPLKAGDKAPEICLPDISGHIQKLSSTKGHVTFVYFWSSGCGFCKRENQDLAYSYRKFHEQGFEMFAVCLDDNVSSWKASIHGSERRYPEVIDTAGMSGRTVADYGLTSLPFNFLIDQYGYIQRVNVPSDELFGILAIIFE